MPSKEGAVCPQMTHQELIHANMFFSYSSENARYYWSQKYERKKKVMFVKTNSYSFIEIM